MDAAALALFAVGLHFVATAAAGPVCTGTPADVIFAMDESSSIWPPHFRKQREFLANLTDGFDIGPERTRIGVVTFADDYTSRFHLDAFKSNAEVKAALQRIDQKTGGTRTDLALKYIREKMLAKSRADVPRIVILVTDGVSSQQQQTTEQSALLKSENVTILVVAISSQINWDEINSIASDPLAKHVFGIKSFNDLSHQLVGQLVRTACEVKESGPVAIAAPRRSTTTTAATTPTSATSRETRRTSTRRPRTTAVSATTAAAAATTTTGSPTTVAEAATRQSPAPPAPLIPSIRVYSERETRLDLDSGRHGVVGVGGAGGAGWYKQPYTEVDVLLPPLRYGYQGLVERPEGVIRLAGSHAALDGDGGGGSDSTAAVYEVRGGGVVEGRASIQLIAERTAAVKLRAHSDDDDDGGGAAIFEPDAVDDPLSGVFIRVLPGEAGERGQAPCDVRRRKADLAVVFGGRRRENAAATLEAVKSLALDRAVPIGPDGVRLALLPNLPRTDMLCSCWSGDRYEACDADYGAGAATEFGFADYGADRAAIADHLSGRDRRRRGTHPDLARHLDALRSRVFRARGGARGGDDAKKVAVIVVDSLPDDLTPAIAAAQLARSAGIQLVLVGVGDAVRRDDLVALSSDPPSKNAFVIRGGHSRTAEDIAKHLYKALC